MKRIPYSIIMILFASSVFADTRGRIDSVLLYQNRARVERKVALNLQKGMNRIELTGFPVSIEDWSVRASLPENFRGRIVSMEVTRHARTEKIKQEIRDLEIALEKLRNEDQALADRLRTLSEKEKFVNAMADFSVKQNQEELAKGTVNVGRWGEALNFVGGQLDAIRAARRRVEQRRVDLGKEIQRLEFELYQLAGSDYYRAYQQLQNDLISKGRAVTVQQYANPGGNYVAMERNLPRQGERIEVEKKIEVMVYASSPGTASLALSYVINGTRWKMAYDFRASRKDTQVDLSVYGNIYQKTGEDWDNVKLTLSTGSPENSIALPRLQPWILDLYQPLNRSASRMEQKAAGAMQSMDFAEQQEPAPVAEDEIPTAEVVQKGPSVSISMPMRHDLPSRSRYQKRFIQDFPLEGASARFFYELFPEKNERAYIRVETVNTSTIPWLPGEAQVFFEGEFMGTVSFPFVPTGKKKAITLGTDPRLHGKKILEKKYEDTSGMFGNRKRIIYHYTLKIVNDTGESREVFVYDALPLSRNEKIEVRMEALSVPYDTSDNFEASELYSQGIRRWKFEMAPRSRKSIRYELSIMYDKDTYLRGLK